MFLFLYFVVHENDLENLASIYALWTCDFILYLEKHWEKISYIVLGSPNQNSNNVLYLLAINTCGKTFHSLVYQCSFCLKYSYANSNIVSTWRGDYIYIVLKFSQNLKLYHSKHTSCNLLFVRYWLKSVFIFIIIVIRMWFILPVESFYLAENI